jgi:hypothetical protein
MRPKEAKNIPGGLQSYVTYDTLTGYGILLTALIEADGPIWKVT